MPQQVQASGSNGPHKQNGTSQPAKVTNVGTKLLTEQDSITATAPANKIAYNYKLKTRQPKASADGASQTKATKAAKE
ncbi:hypothetical protein BOTNAR_2035g00010 [Botryotinia narcissicola]|uniref:Uncharacterized protein n=1 Tax=Botryotinia narcissicola TaxID=278944 RepID=A0A4Z1HEY3_9HELO|nr:hypothetical protein BOTNAR_2035g00010 [Botryotinia narcissicola]